MSILKKLQKDRLLFRKENRSNEMSWATSLYSEIVKVGKDNGNRETTEAESIQVIKTFLKNLRISIEEVSKRDNKSKLGLLKEEESFYLTYLPAQLTNEELKEVIGNIIADNNFMSLKYMGEIMKILNNDYNGRFEGKLASILIKELLS